MSDIEFFLEATDVVRKVRYWGGEVRLQSQSGWRIQRPPRKREQVSESDALEARRRKLENALGPKFDELEARLRNLDSEDSAYLNYILEEYMCCTR